MTAREETKITPTAASEETIEEIPHINSTDSWGDALTRCKDQFASMPILHREVSSGLSFNESCNMLTDDLEDERHAVIWQESERLSQMQIHSGYASSTIALFAAPHSKRMIPWLDWRLLQGPIGCREQMEQYAKRDPLFVASLFLKLKASSDYLDLDQMLSWLSETVINVHKLCTKPMVLITLNEELSYANWDFKHYGSWRLDVSIIETGHTIKIPQYQALHDPTCTRPRTIPPPHSVPAVTANTSSSNNQQLVPAANQTSPPTCGPKPPPIPPLPNSNLKPEPEVSRIPEHKNTSTLDTPFTPSSSSKELTISQRLEELMDVVKRQEALLESVARRLG
ncbi:hypothetical protein BDN72DRAFT_906408 [Pluteus cervinus]|uniref:Uncharacterized protein n=1 Tax=Pluteus cervinus TaxID=181527 RepID=A0ACD2ZYX5_9AGAR|nr:hypothetical protein BDN72DRAFT_906408 [Pluteus cervinus]